MRTKHVEKHDELWLLNLANNLLGSTGLNDKPNGLLFEANGKIRDPMRWHQMLHFCPMGPLRKKIAEMNLSTLASVVVFAESNPTTGSHFRATTIRAFLRGPQDILGSLNFGTIFIAIDGTFGLRIMRYLAELVLVGMMYDILMAEEFRSRGGYFYPSSDCGVCIHHPKNWPQTYDPRCAMVNFVEKHRLNRRTTKANPTA